uniref:BRCT domain-containing protein n=1 Tax=Angiostrongylus cantonensis TaxID=6313 RepID=A0A0K0DCP5_ANGCA
MVECPICRKKLNKRSCTASEQHDSIVQGYLHVGRNFRMDLEEQSFSIPEDIAYAESQVPATHVPRDSPVPSRCPPQFTLPKARGRRKKIRGTHIASKIPKMDRIVEEDVCDEGESALVKQVGQILKEQMSIESDVLTHKSSVGSAINLTSVGVQCNFLDSACSCSIRNSLQCLLEKFVCYPNLHAIFELTPELKESLLAEMVNMLHELFELQPPTTSGNQQAIGSLEGPQSSAEIIPDSFPGDDNCVELGAQCHVQPKSVQSHDMAQEVKLSPLSRERFDSNEIYSADDDSLNITIQVPFESYPEEVPSHFAIEEKENIVVRPMVFCVSRSSGVADENLVREFLSMFPSVQFNEELGSSCTHLIMMNSRKLYSSIRVMIEKSLCNRKSFAYLYAVAHKCEVIARVWLEECIKSRQLLPTAKYGVTFESAGEDPGWIRARQTSEPLFDQMNFFLPTSFSDSGLLSKKSLVELITICGGSCFDKPWEIASSKNSYTIFMPYSIEVDAARRYEASMHGVPVLLADWVLDSIAQYRILPLDAYKICK